jgi:tetratricopeptide (TPR) repeat protein/transcriptional regulator with XRE-family HTH domain
MATTDTPTFGTLLRRYRLLAGLSQEALAERAHLSIRAVGALEQRSNRAPRAATLALLADALALSAQERAALVAAAQQDSGAARHAGAGHASRQGRTTLLVGRAEELAVLDHHLAGEGPPMLLLAGEPGIGKSRLLEEAAQRGVAAGWQVLQAGCTRSGGQFPHTPLLQALQRQIRGLAVDQQRMALRGCAWLVRLLPELADGPIEPLPPWTVSPEQERRLMFEAVERFLANVAGPAGTLLLLDDLQWAGADALDLLTSLVRATATPLRLVGAYRDTEVHPHDPLAVTLADLAGASLARHHSLRPLATAEVQDLLDLLLDGRGGDHAVVAARVTERTGGVPFFVVSCAQALREDAAAGVEAIPWEVAQGIRQRVAVLPATAQEVLGAAAITVGRTMQAPILAGVLEQPERVVLGAMESAWRAGLLEDADGRYRIAHDLIREVLEADLGPARREMLHRRTAEVLEGQPGAASAEVLAYHYRRSDVPERAVGYLEQAGDQAQAQQGRAAAEGFYREAVERLDGLSRPLDAARVREKLGVLLHTGAQYAEALASLEPAAEAYRVADDLKGAGRVEAAIALVHSARGTPAEGLARLEPVLALLAGQDPSPVTAALYNAQGDVLFLLGRLREDLAASEQAERIARLVGDDRQLAYAIDRRGVALCKLGRLEEAAQAEAACIQVAEAAGNQYMLCWSLINMGLIHLEGGSFVAARQATERALQLAERHGFRICAASATLQRGWLSFLTGGWEAARRDLEVAAAMGRAIGPFFAEADLSLKQARLCLAEEAEAEAARHLEHCEQLLHSGRYASARLGVVSVLAERDLLAGQAEAARARLVLWLDPDTPQEEDVTPLLPLLAWALLDLDELDEAAAAAWQAVALAREQGRKALLVDALRVAAMVAARQGRSAAAEGALAEGLSLARRLGYPYGEARLLLVSGELLVQMGQPEPAREHLEAASVIFGRLGARKDLEQAEQVLTMLD